MRNPLIPAIITGVTGLMGLGGIFKLLGSGKQIKREKSRYDARRRTYDIAEQNYKACRESAQGRLDELGTTRLHALETLGKAAKFLKRAKVKDRDLLKRVEITPQRLTKWETASIQAISVRTAIAKGSVSGLASASAVYGLVGALGAASTGTAISTLSGAAATNATLAWLGGGAIAAGGGGMALGAMVLNGIIVGPALLVSSYFVGRKVEEIKTTVDTEIAKMDVAEAQMQKQLAECETILKRVDELLKSTVEMDKMLTDALSTADPENLEDVYNVAKVAKSLGTLLDIAILDKKGI
ncbi:MAG: hypothetical protein MN733_22945 [Nitrososphaera sp.]|nr:hypothetical protein [Nitrososphaera sp.]